MSCLPKRKLSPDGLTVNLLGFGTTWFGRPWPPGNSAYTNPDFLEITNYLNFAYSALVDKTALMLIDTSSSYGSSEKKLGQYFKQHSGLLPLSIIATKWGEEFDPNSGETRLDHSRQHLRNSLKRSISYLGKIDLLYIHRTSKDVLQDRNVIEEMEIVKQNGQLAYIGASFSNVKTLEVAVNESLINWCDVIQMPASVFLKRPDLINIIRMNNTAVVVNSPIRKGENKSPSDIYATLIKQKDISVILTGTRNHLSETLDYFSSDHKIYTKQNPN